LEAPQQNKHFTCLPRTQFLRLLRDYSKAELLTFLHLIAKTWRYADPATKSKRREVCKLSSQGLARHVGGRSAYRALNKLCKAGVIERLEEAGQYRLLLDYPAKDFIQIRNNVLDAILKNGQQLSLMELRVLLFIYWKTLAQDRGSQWMAQQYITGGLQRSSRCAVAKALSGLKAKGRIKAYGKHRRFAYWGINQHLGEWITVKSSTQRIEREDRLQALSVKSSTQRIERESPPIPVSKPVHEDCQNQYTKTVKTSTQDLESLRLESLSLESTDTNKNGTNPNPYAEQYERVCSHPLYEPMGEIYGQERARTLLHSLIVEPGVERFRIEEDGRVIDTLLSGLKRSGHTWEPDQQALAAYRMTLTQNDSNPTIHP